MDRLANLIRRKILTHELGPGVLLPAERLLSDHLGVSRNTLRSALARIESEGLLEIRQGRGVMVRDYRSVGSLSLVANMPSEMQDDIFPEILDLRRTLAVNAAVKACAHATETELDELAELARQISGCDEVQETLRLDIEFSRALVRAARSIPLELLLNSVSALLLGRPDIVDALFNDREEVNASYTIMVELLRSRDERTVRKLMQSGLEHRDRETLEILRRNRVTESREDVRADGL